MPLTNPTLLFATDPEELKTEMRIHGHVNVVVEAETPMHAKCAHRFGVNHGKTVAIVDEFIEPVDPAERHVIVSTFRAAPAGSAVLIYVRPASRSLQLIMRDHPEIREEMYTALSAPSDLL